MGTFAETPVVDYRSSFADQGKQTSVFHFRLQRNKLKFAVSIFRFSKQTKSPFFISSISCVCVWGVCAGGWGSWACFSNGKWKTEALVLLLNPFTACSSCKSKFVACLFVDEQTKGSYPFANRSYPFANGLNKLARMFTIEKLQVFK
jgi:hypothetical protein